MTWVRPGSTVNRSGETERQVHEPVTLSTATGRVPRFTTGNDQVKSFVSQASPNDS